MMGGSDGAVRIGSLQDDVKFVSNRLGEELVLEDKEDDDWKTGNYVQMVK